MASLVEARYTASNDYTGGTELMTALHTAGRKDSPPSAGLAATVQFCFFSNMHVR